MHAAKADSVVKNTPDIFLLNTEKFYDDNFLPEDQNIPSHFNIHHLLRRKIQKCLLKKLFKQTKQYFLLKKKEENQLAIP